VSAPSPLSLRLSYEKRDAGTYQLTALERDGQSQTLSALRGECGPATAQLCLLLLHQAQRARRTEESIEILDGELARRFAALLAKSPPWHTVFFGESRIFESTSRQGHRIFARTGACAVTVVVDDAEVTTTAGAEPILRWLRACIDKRVAGHSSSPPPLAVTGGRTSQSAVRAPTPPEGVSKQLGDALRFTHSDDWDRINATDCNVAAWWSDPRIVLYFVSQVKRYLSSRYAASGGGLTFSTEVTTALRRTATQAKSLLGRWIEPFQDHPVEALFRGPKSQRSKPATCEVVRVLIWTPEDLKTGVGDAIIQLHATCDIPLFYLSPPLKPNAREYILKYGNDGSVRGLAWDVDQWAAIPSPTLSFDPAEDFLSMLRHPKLLLAVHALHLIKAGSWEAFETAPEARPEP
jgi:hypothetical protein